MKLRGFQTAVCLMVTGFFVLSLSGAFSMGLLRAEIPFSFYVENQSFPAGEYLITRGERGQALTIRQVDGKEFTSVIVQPARRSNTTESSSLSFHKYGNVYFLRNISSADTMVSGFLLTSKKEKILASEMVKTKGIGSQAEVRLTIPVE